MLQQRYRVDACALYASGTHALQAALQAALQKKNGVVLLPAYTCYEVATAAVGAGANVVLYDVDAETLEPDWASVSRAATGHNVSALVVTPLYGMPLDWQAARAAALRLDALLVADVAQGFGTLSDGAPAGTGADFIVLSFGRGKGWTGAGGGALLSDQQLLAQTQIDGLSKLQFMRELKTLLKAVSQWVLGRPALYGLPAALPFLRLGETVYHPPTPPAPMTRTSAFLLLAGELEAGHEVLHRRRNAGEYSRALAAAGPAVTALIGARLDDSAGALRYPVRVRDGWAGQAGTAAAKMGVAAGYPTTLRELPALQPLLRNAGDPLPGAELLVRELITLPTHAQVPEAQRARLVALICGANSTNGAGHVAQARHPAVGANV